MAGYEAGANGRRSSGSIGGLGARSVAKSSVLWRTHRPWERCYLFGRTDRVAHNFAVEGVVLPHKSIHEDQRLGMLLKRAEQAMLQAKNAVLKPIGLTLPQYFPLAEL